MVQWCWWKKREQNKNSKWHSINSIENPIVQHHVKSFINLQAEVNFIIASKYSDGFLNIICFFLLHSHFFHKNSEEYCLAQGTKKNSERIGRNQAATHHNYNSSPFVPYASTYYICRFYNKRIITIADQLQMDQKIEKFPRWNFHRNFTIELLIK